MIFDFKVGNFYEWMQLCSFVLLALFLPLTSSYLPYFMFFCILSTLYRKGRVGRLQNKYLFVWGLSILFVIHLISLGYSVNHNSALNNLERMLSFVFIPIATFFLSEKVKGNNKLIIYTFLLSSSLAAFYCLGIAFSNSYIINEQGNGFCWSVSGDFCGYSFLRLILLRKSFFSYRYFSQLHHATYFAMYITFVIGVLFYIFSKMKRVKWLITYALGILFFLFINFLLASRAGYITTVLLIVFSFVWFFHYKVKRRYIIIGTIVLLFAAGFLLMKTRLGNNMQEVVALIFEEEVPKENLDPRLLLWNVGVDLAREAPIWGYGVGDVHDKLDELYEERGMYKELVQHFNVHNQYLSVYLATGILGLGVLLYWFFGSLILGIRTRNYLLSVFMLIIIINALFENILDRSAGLAFILLFYPILMHQSLQKKRDDT